jgi:hypothetical protein
MIEGVRLDFFGERNEGLPEEVTQLYLRRETVALGRQIEQALTLAFGDNSRQRGRLRELGLTAASSRSLMDVQLLVSSYIADLQQIRVELLRSRMNSPRSALVMQDSLHAERSDRSNQRASSWKCSTSVTSYWYP